VAAFVVMMQSSFVNQDFGNKASVSLRYQILLQKNDVMQSPLNCIYVTCV